MNKYHLLDLPCLKEYSDWDPVGAEAAELEILQDLADSANVEISDWLKAKGILFEEGYTGYSLDDEMSFASAKKIIEKSKQCHFSDIYYQNPDYDLNCDHMEACDCTNAVICGSEIYKDVWSWYRKIYG